MKRKKLIILFILLASFCIIAFTWWSSGLAAQSPNDKTQKIFVVNKGDSIRDIASKLKQQNLIKDPVVFFLLIKQKGLDQKIEAGDFRLSPSMTANQIAEELTHGVLDIWVTIPEGLRAEEIADILQQKLPQYKSSWRDLLTQKEGYLFPDTYLIPRDADITMILSTLSKNFDKKYTLIPNSKLLDKQTVVTTASLTEREARTPEDKKLVASVIANRLRIGMALQVDATIQYALGYQANDKTWWKKTLTFDDLKISSPYNTYLNPGLPPTPISNPGGLALQAAANPMQTDYLYYITDKSGHNHYAKTASEHEANKRKYGI